VEPEQPFEAVWPWSPSGVRFDDPVEAARSFAVDFVGFEDPVVGEFMAGDNRSGEVEVQARENGAVTTVFVRQLGPDDTWWVLGSATENIVVTSPEALQEVASPLELTGMARAFEGTVNVEVRVDGDVGPLATTFVTGSGTEDLGPFEGEVTWTTPPAQPGGAVVFVVFNAEDGSVWEAGVVRVLFAS
jgi:hypothetical protein